MRATISEHPEYNQYDVSIHSNDGKLLDLVRHNTNPKITDILAAFKTLMIPVTFERFDGVIQSIDSSGNYIDPE